LRGDDESGGNAGGGGSIRIGTHALDSFDPVLPQTIQAYQALQLVYTPLLTYKAGERNGAQLIPGLAEEMPHVTDGGKTYSLRLREGLHYTDGSPVRSSDFEHSVKRALALGSPWSSFYSGIVGAQRFTEAGAKESRDIEGIEADDDTRKITITLTEPDGTFPNVLAFIYTAPTPAAKSPFTSLTDRPPPGLGRYRLKIVDPSQEFVLTRNRDFDIPGIEPGRTDKITGVVRGSCPA
jgi:peptide/nickel transport system substrate-binding protein